MRAGVQIEQVTAFVDVNQRNHIRPAVLINGTHVRCHLASQKILGLRLRHLALGAEHLSAQIRMNGIGFFHILISFAA
jgi:hypothetical protein